MSILFYRTAETYGSFSNFSKHPINIKGKDWRTTEHYYQAQKFAGTDHEEAVRLCQKPSEAAKMGRDKTLPLRADWEEVKEGIMMDALKAKVAQYPDVKALLLSTGDELIAEHTSNDNYWADNGDGTGKNRLGVLLMQLREELRAEEKVKNESGNPVPVV